MANAQCCRKLVQGNYSWIAEAVFQPRNILLTKSRLFRKRFLREPLFSSDPSGVRSHKFAHVHAQSIGFECKQSLSTIICIVETETHLATSLLRTLTPALLLVSLPALAADQKPFEQRPEKQQAKRNEAIAKLTPELVANQASVDDEDMEPLVTISTEPAFKWKGGFTDNVRSDNYIRAFIDRSGDGAIYQVVQSVTYLYERRRFNGVNVMLPSGLKTLELTVIAEDLNCSIGVCVYTDYVGFRLTEEEVESITDLYKANPTASLKMRFKSASSLDWNDDIAAVEFVGLQRAVAAWQAKSDR